ncbi:MAG: hypothetical protein Q9195_004032 [Heterodermia aff. obscurata]
MSDATGGGASKLADVHPHWRFEKPIRHFVEPASFVDIEASVEEEKSTQNPLLGVQNPQKVRSKKRPKHAPNWPKTNPGRDRISLKNVFERWRTLHNGYLQLTSMLRLLTLQEMKNKCPLVNHLLVNTPLCHLHQASSTACLQLNIPVSTLAPEVDTNGERSDTNKIDIRGIDSVCSQLLSNPFIVENFGTKNRPDDAWHRAITAKLSEYGKTGSLEDSFANLSIRMLAWDPRRRLTATEALQHPCLQGLDEESSSSSSESQVKTSYSNKAPRLIKPTDDDPNYNQSGDTEVASSGARCEARPPSFDSNGETGATWAEFHQRQAQARLEASTMPSKETLLRRP